jgi:hypothetical protein
VKLALMTDTPGIWRFTRVAPVRSRLMPGHYDSRSKRGARPRPRSLLDGKGAPLVRTERLLDVLCAEPSTACPERPRLLGGRRRPDASDKCDQDE